MRATTTRTGTVGVADAVAVGASVGRGGVAALWCAGWVRLTSTPAATSAASATAASLAPIPPVATASAGALAAGADAAAVAAARPATPAALAAAMVPAPSILGPDDATPIVTWIATVLPDARLPVRSPATTLVGPAAFAAPSETVLVAAVVAVTVFEPATTAWAPLVSTVLVVSV